MGDDYQFPPVISLTQQPKTLGFTKASNIANGNNATDFFGNDQTIRKITITGDINTMFLLCGVPWRSSQIKARLEMQGCSTSINLESIKQERDSPAGKV